MGGGLRRAGTVSRLKEILHKKRQREERLESALQSVTARLRDLGALKVVVFGSLAHRDVDAFSDLDLLVVMPPEKSGREWSRTIYESMDLGIASDLIIYNEKELEENLATSSFLRGILDSGRTVYEKTLRG